MTEEKLRHWERLRWEMLAGGAADEVSFPREVCECCCLPRRVLAVGRGPTGRPRYFPAMLSLCVRIPAASHTTDQQP